MHPVLGTMMPEICEAPRLPVFFIFPHGASDLMVGGVHLIPSQDIHYDVIIHHKQHHANQQEKINCTE